ncbi:MAG: hypothetical protein NVSMB3_00940 [Acidobacteriaceae bacterium]
MVCTLAFLALTVSLTTCALPQAPAQASGAKQKPSAVQIDNAESTSKPDDVQIPEANPARPTITNPAHIPPVGYVQFEQGLLQANGSPGGVARQFSLNEVIKISLHPRWMVQFSTQPFAHSRVDDMQGPGTPQSDPGDLQMGVQGLLTKESGLKPTVALGYMHRARAGSSPDIDLGSFSQSALLLVSGDAGKFHYDTNFSVSEQIADPVRRAQFAQSLSVTHDLFAEALHDRLEITGELWHATQPLVSATREGVTSPRSNAVGNLWALGYAVRPNLVIDGGFDHGLTSTSTDWETFAGFTYLLPHRLWRHEEGTVQPRPHRHIHRR